MIRIGRRRRCEVNREYIRYQSLLSFIRAFALPENTVAKGEFPGSIADMSRVVRFGSDAEHLDQVLGPMSY